MLYPHYCCRSSAPLWSPTAGWGAPPRTAAPSAPPRPQSWSWWRQTRGRGEPGPLHLLTINLNVSSIPCVPPPQSSNFWKSLTMPWLTIDIVHIVSWLHQVLFEHGLVRVVLISPTRTLKTFEEVLLRWKDVSNVCYLLSFNFESPDWARITVVIKRRIIGVKCL